MALAVSLAGGYLPRDASASSIQVFKRSSSSTSKPIVLRTIAPHVHTASVRGMGYGIWGMGYGVWGMGYGVWGMYGVWDMGYEVWGMGYV